MSELVMITDLLRNDLGKISDYGSIRVPDLARLERFSHVQHLVSTVEGRLRTGITHLEALAACFPGGSITGAPKIRAMEIIDELEIARRGAYGGCVGYIGANGTLDTCITLRTAVVKDGMMHVQAGGGVVADSDPTYEYNESKAKARGLIRAAEEALRFAKN
jgi:anthranilate synthase component 1